MASEYMGNVCLRACVHMYGGCTKRLRTQVNMNEKSADTTKLTTQLLT
jgi:hypothetical protein